MIAADVPAGTIPTVSAAGRWRISRPVLAVMHGLADAHVAITREMSNLDSATELPQRVFSVRVSSSDFSWKAGHTGLLRHFAAQTHADWVSPLLRYASW